jgi:hypothetical protein
MVVLGVEWVQAVFNISGPVGGPDTEQEMADVTGMQSKMKRRNEGQEETSQEERCNTPCTVDAVARVGFPERLQSNNTTNNTNTNTTKNASEANIVGSRADGELLVLISLGIVLALWVAGGVGSM